MFGMFREHRLSRVAASAALLFLSLAVWTAAGPATATSSGLDPFAATPSGPCGPGSRPETTQGRTPLEDFASGRAAKGYTCNTEQVAHYGTTGGYRTFDYVDTAGRRCAFYDTTLLFPGNAAATTGGGTGVYALDMSSSHNPVRTATLSTPAMQSPHESLSLNVKRGLLAADMGYPTFQPGFVDFYDVSQDCRHPALLSSSPLGVLGHEGGFAPDGNTYYASSAGGNTLTAIDVTNPATPSIVWSATNWSVHGLNVSPDGNRIYFADLGSTGRFSPSGTDGSAGLTILDVSQVQKRVASPQVKVISHLTWPQVSIPQTPIPVTISTGSPKQPHKFLVEVDEFAKSALSFNADDPVGAARIINIDNEKHPVVVSNLRLAVNSPDARKGPQQNDPDASSGLQGYAAHYCAVPNRIEPGIAACSFILSGLRVFDIRDPYHPKEIAYFNQPPPPDAQGQSGSYAMSAPSFVPALNEIRYSDGNSGFYVVRLTNGAWPAR
jgi:hypothetical protein